ncbi:MAG: hypothetical protein RBS68_16260 [Anaerolineales bacterium]|jgi:hypothetical protein|nr:hypothetical protein [Anaerolineales bacterium]
MQIIPLSLAPFFQEYDLAQLDPQRDAATIIERTLQFGNRAELRWLFTQYPRAQISDWFKKYASERLPNPHNTFWQIILEIKE